MQNSFQYSTVIKIFLRVDRMTAESSNRENQNCQLKQISLVASKNRVKFIQLMIFNDHYNQILRKMLKPFKLKVMINEHAEGNLGAKRREKGEGILLQDWQDLWYFS